MKRNLLAMIVSQILSHLFLDGGVEKSGGMDWSWSGGVEGSSVFMGYLKTWDELMDCTWGVMDSDALSAWTPIKSRLFSGRGLGLKNQAVSLKRKHS